MGEMQWDVLAHVLGVGGQGEVDYVAFVQRFRVGMHGNEVSDQWTEELLAKIYGRLLTSDVPLRELLEFFDTEPSSLRSSLLGPRSAELVKNLTGEKIRGGKLMRWLMKKVGT